MSESVAPNGGADEAMLRNGVRLNWVLVAIVALEAVALWAAVFALVIGMVSGGADSFSSGIALTVLAAVAAVWLSATAVAVARAQRWARGSVITWQVMQVAIAVGAVQGSDPSWGVAVLLTIPAVAAVLLVVVRPVRAVYGLYD